MPKWLPFPRPTFSQILTIAGVCVAIFLIASLGQRWLVCREVLARKQVEMQSVEAERARLRTLQQKWAEAQSAASIEKAIREELGWIRENEHLVALQYEGLLAGEELTAQPAVGQRDSPPYWPDWLRLFLLP